MKASYILPALVLFAVPSISFAQTCTPNLPLETSCQHSFEFAGSSRNRASAISNALAKRNGMALRQCKALTSANAAKVYVTDVEAHLSGESTDDRGRTVYLASGSGNAHCTPRRRGSVFNR
jgi:hypothetical protein